SRIIGPTRETRMKAIWLSLASFPLAAITSTAFACGDSVRSEMGPTAEVTGPADQADSRLALTVLGPSGATYHLVYTAGQGWQFVDLPTRIAPIKVKSSVDLALPFAATSGEVHPQTVFIDGPTGYTFVWVADGGWKFVGNITGADR